VWFDVLRGIAILLVVLGHALRGIDGSGISGGAQFGFLDVRLYAVHVQLLFFVSGLLVVGSLLRRDTGSFVQGRFPALLWPLVIWTYVFLAVKLLAGPHQNEPITWDAILVSPIPGQLHLWFLWALLLMHLAAAAIWAITSARRRTGVFLAIFVLSLAGQWLRLPPEVDRWTGSAFLFFPYFALGIVIGLSGVCARQSPGVSLAALGCAAVAFLFAPQLRALSGSFALPSVLACIGAYFSASLILRMPRVTAVFAGLGVSAMAIYVLHTIFSAGTREALLALGIPDLSTHLVLGVLAGVLLPILVREACLRFRLARPLALA
jgi:fucose 4-O-acetylase-like acetyltransferase